MKELLDLSLDLVKSKRTHFSFILKKNRIVAIGEEQRGKTHPLAQKFGYKYPTIHSELDAFRKLSLEDRNAKLMLVNTRISPTGNIGMARPCRHCRGWIEEIFGEIWFTNQDGVLEKYA